MPWEAEFLGGRRRVSRPIETNQHARTSQSLGAGGKCPEQEEQQHHHPPQNNASLLSRTEWRQLPHRQTFQKRG